MSAASNNDNSSSEDQRRNHHNEVTNPFVAFRRFADEQMSSLMNGVFGAFHDSPFKRQQAIEDYEAWLKKARENAQKNHPTSEQEPQARPRCSSWWSSAADTESSPPKETYMWTTTPHSFFDNLFSFSYLLYDPYSPLVLEQRDLPHKYGRRWRAAFEDLLHAQNGEELPQRDDGPEQTHTESPLAWARDMNLLQLSQQQTALQRQGGVEPARSSDWFPKPGNTSTSQPDDDDEDDEEKPAYTESQRANARLFRRGCSFLQRCWELERPEDQRKCESIWAAAFVGGNTEAEEEEDDDVNNYYYDDDDDDDDDEDEEDVESPESSLERQASLDEHPHLLNILEEVNKRRLRQIWEAESAAANTGAEEVTDPAPSLSPLSSERPSVLSTLTTTETRTLPDGSKTTRVVLKKRFADGAEESTERVYAQNANAIADAARVSAAVRRTSDQVPGNTSGSSSNGSKPSETPRDEKNAKGSGSETGGNKKGWFWS